MKTSDKGIQLIKQSEGVRLKVYKDSVGLRTIGIGHKLLPDEHFTTITEEEAVSMLKHDLGMAEKTINKVVKVPLNQNQFDALVSLTFNIGSGAFYKSTLLRQLNQGNYKIAAGQFLVWNKGTVEGKLKPIEGLTKRRERERELFLTLKENTSEK